MKIMYSLYSFIYPLLLRCLSLRRLRLPCNLAISIKCQKPPCPCCPLSNCKNINLQQKLQVTSTGHAVTRHCTAEDSSLSSCCWCCFVLLLLCGGASVLRRNVVREIEGKYHEAVIGSLKPGPEQLSRSDGEREQWWQWYQSATAPQPNNIKRQRNNFRAAEELSVRGIIQRRSQ